MPYCPIQTCRLAIDPGHLLCRTHWALVPKMLQLNVYHYNKKRPGGPSHRSACRLAIDAVHKTLDIRQREIDEKAKPVKSQLPYRDD